MPGLSNIFGSDDSDNSSSDNNGSLDVVGDVTSTVGLDLNSSNESWDRDEEGNESYDSSDNSLGLDASTDGLLGAVSDITSSNEQSDS